jgi:hypothetical protein
LVDSTLLPVLISGLGIAIWAIVRLVLRRHARRIRRGRARTHIWVTLPRGAKEPLGSRGQTRVCIPLDVARRIGAIPFRNDPT